MTFFADMEDGEISSYKQVYDDIKQLTKDTLNTIKAVKKTIDKIEEEVENLEDKIDDIRLETETVVIKAIDDLKKEKQNIRDGRNGRGLIVVKEAIATYMVCGKEESKKQCLLNIGLATLIPIINTVRMELNLPELEKMKKKIMDEDNNIQKFTNSIKTNLKEYRNILDNEENAINEWEKEAESLEYILPNWTKKSKIPSRIISVLRRLKFKAQEYLEVIRCVFQEGKEKNNRLQVFIVDGSASLISGDRRIPKNGAFTFQEGEEINLKCDVDCADSVEWFKNEARMAKESGGQDSFIGNRFLWISSAAKKNEGSYMCRAKSGTKYETATIKVKVNTVCVDEVSFNCAMVSSSGFCQMRSVAEACCESCKNNLQE